MRTLVFGGTGNVGREVVKRLLAANEEVFIMSREAAPRHLVGAQIVHGDLDDLGSLRTAVRDMDRAFLLVAQGPNEVEQGLAAVDAVRDANVSRLVYMSVRMPSFAPDVPHFATKHVIEAAVRRSGIPFAILRPNNFFQNDLALLNVILDYGIYPQPIGSNGVSRVDVRDIADAAVATLLRDHDGETYELNGPDPLTGASVAEEYARHLGRPVQYAGDSLDAWSASVRDVLPAWLVRDLSAMYAQFQIHGMLSSALDDSRLRALLGRSPRSFSAFVAEVVEAVSTNASVAA